MTRAASSARLVEADDGAGRFLACSLYQRGDGRAARVRPREDRDRRRPLADARLGEPERALALQRHRGEHRHLGCARSPGDAAAALERAPRAATPPSSRATRPSVVDELWRPAAKEQLRLLEAGRPLTHRLVGLPGVSRRVGALRGPLNGLLVDG